MKIEYYRQEIKRLELLLAQLRAMIDSSYYWKIRTVMTSLDGSLEGFSLDDCDNILDDFYVGINAGWDDTWIVMTIFVNYYCFVPLEFEEAIFHCYLVQEGSSPNYEQLKMVDVDNDLLGDKKDWSEVLSRYCDMDDEEFRRYCSGM